MRIVLDIKEELIDQWGCLVVEPVPPVNGQYKPPKVMVPCFVYRVPDVKGESTFSAMIGPGPKKNDSHVNPPGVTTGAVKTVAAKADLHLHEEQSGSAPEPAAAPEPQPGPPPNPPPEPQPEPDEAAPSDEEKSGNAKPGGKKK